MDIKISIYTVSYHNKLDKLGYINYSKNMNTDYQ